MWAEVYYPAASLFRAATVTFNFGPDFACPPQDAEAAAARPCSQLATPAAPAEPMEADDAPADEAEAAA